MFTKDQLVSLRKHTLTLHAAAGHLITVPTEAAITGSGDEEEIKTAMSGYMLTILRDFVRIERELNMESSAVDNLIARARAEVKL